MRDAEITIWRWRGKRLYLGYDLDNPSWERWTRDYGDYTGWGVQAGWFHLEWL